MDGIFLILVMMSVMFVLWSIIIKAVIRKEVRQMYMELREKEEQERKTEEENRKVEEWQSPVKKRLRKPIKGS